MAQKKKTHSWLSAAVLALFAGALMTFLSASANAAPQKRALIIGMSNYRAYDGARSASAGGRDASNFGNLHGTVDGDAIDTLLRQQLVNDRCTVTGNWAVDKLAWPTKKPTAAGIKSAFEDLIKATGAGDVVVIYYSGHGVQVPDDASPAAKGALPPLIDAIVPLDYDVDLKNVITGHMINAYLTRLAAKHPLNVTVIFDCCHSAMADKGTDTAKGITYGDYADWLAKAVPGVKVHAADPVAKGTPSVADGAGASYIYIAACRSSESAYEKPGYKPAGNLTRALIDAITNSPEGTTYRMLYDRVAGIMASKYKGEQSPDMYPLGEGADTLIFGGAAKGATKYTPVTCETDGRLTLRAGELLGVTSGSVYAIYPYGDTKFTDDTMIATATVTEKGLDAYSAELSAPTFIPGHTAKEFAGGPQAIEKTHNFAASALTVSRESIQAVFAPNAEGPLRDINGLGVARLVSKSEKPDIEFRKVSDGAKGGDSVAIVRLDTGATVKKFTLDGMAANTAGESIKTLATAKFMMSMADTGQKQIEIRMQALNEPTISQRAHIFNGFKANPNVLTRSDWAVIQVRNLTGNDANVAILDINPDGKMVQLWPPADFHKESSIIKPSTGPNDWVTLWRTDGPNKNDPRDYVLINFANVLDGECLEGFATSELVPFGKYHGYAKGEKPKEATNPLQTLMLTGMSGAKDINVGAAPANWSAAVLPIKLTEPEKK